MIPRYSCLLAAALLVMLVLPSGVEAQDLTPPGIGPGLFAQIGLDAYALSMGGAMVAAPGGPALPYYNPAALAGANRLSIGGMYSSPYGRDFGVSYQYISILGPLGEQTDSSSALGVGLTYMSSQICDIPIWDEEGFKGTATSQATAYTASFGIPLLRDLKVGAALRYYSARLLEGAGEGFGFDIAILGSASLGSHDLHFGITSLDTGNSIINWTSLSGTTRNVIPWTTRIGLAVVSRGRDIRVAADWDVQPMRGLADSALHAGVEYRLVRFLALRGGIQKSLDAPIQFAAGIGLQIGDTLSLSYAYQPARAFKDTHLLVLSVSF